MNFTSFAPLGTVLVALLGIGVAEGSGLLASALRLLVISAPKRLLTFVIVFAGVAGGYSANVLLGTAAGCAGPSPPSCCWASSSSGPHCRSGLGAETHRSDAQVIKGMGKAMETLGLYLVITLIVAFVARWDPKAGIGTVIATMLPYTAVFLVVWALLLVVWVFLGIPVGPGSPLFIPVAQG